VNVVPATVEPPASVASAVWSDVSPMWVSAIGPVGVTAIVTMSCDTVNATEPCTPPAVAEIVDVPFPTAVGRPEFTVITLGFDDDHENELLTVAPSESLAVDCSCTVAPKDASNVVGAVTSTDET
jgi:hypothetical protein